MKYDPIVIKGAREHNLKNVSLEIPSQKLVVITGPSGSGKSSLAFDTLFAEGQRRFMESLSSYARQFLEQLSRPDFDLLDGLSPSIAIDQKTISNHPRSTVGTVTNIYDFIRLLYARMGEVRDPDTGEELRANTEDDLSSIVKKTGEGKRIRLYAAVVRGKKGEFLREFEKWRRAGFSSVIIDGKRHSLHDPILIQRYQIHDIDLLVDSFEINFEELDKRITEAFRVASELSEGHLKCHDVEKDVYHTFNKNIASASGKSFPDLEPRLFSFNSPYGMCTECKGLGYIDLSKIKKKDSDEVEGTFEKDMSLVKTCPSCKGARLRDESLHVFFNKKNIFEVVNFSCYELIDFFNKLPKELLEHPVVERIGLEVKARLQFLINVGVGYLSLGRRSNTLSGGEAQRIRLATQLGSQLSGVLYVLDEPSIGLHPRDHQKLLKSLENLRNLGNTVLVVEHDEETIRMADYIIDIGPGAGIKGGELICHGPPEKFMADKKSVTASYLRGESNVSEQRPRRKGNGKYIEITGCKGNNLQDVSLKLPLGKLITFSGVSGSGKSSLVRDTLEAAISKSLYKSKKDPLKFSKILGVENIDKMVHVDQKPIGRSPRSNPATYTGLFSLLRNLYSQLPEAQIRGYLPGTFSFNVKGGRCDNCEGAGRLKVEMHFLPDTYIQCDVCDGHRYRREVLEVRYKGKNISEVLQMSIEEAYAHFKAQPLINSKIKTLLDVGLGYIKLGQSAVTLSGGEAQRIKLAKELSKRSTGKTIYFLDEPTTGLHFNDVKKLLDLLQVLAERGNTVVVIEHNMDVICAADWIVDIGPDAGSDGGKITFEGIPEKIAKKPKLSPTAKYVNRYFKEKKWQSL